eukprot:6559348-Prymnesium_polylepis.1
MPPRQVPLVGGRALWLAIGLDGEYAPEHTLTQRFVRRQQCISLPQSCDCKRVASEPQVAWAT